MLGCACWGAVPPRRPGWSCRGSCCYGNAGSVLGTGGGWELGAPPRSPHLRESVWWEAGGGPLGRLLSERGDGAMLDYFAASVPLQLPAFPAPPSPSPTPLAPAALGWQPFSGQGPGALVCSEGGGAVGTWSHAGCRLTVRSGADPGRSCRVRVGSRRLRLERQTRWEGGGRLGPPPCPPLLYFWERRSFS